MADNITRSIEKSEELVTRPNTPTTDRRTILLVDDDNILLLINKTILQSDGYEVFTACDGSEALALLSRIAMPNLILLDMFMKGMSGPEFLKKIEETRPDILNAVPVIFLTAMDKVPTSKASGFIRKPMDLKSFLKSVDRFIAAGVGYKRLQN